MTNLAYLLPPNRSSARFDRYDRKSAFPQEESADASSFYAVRHRAEVLLLDALRQSQLPAEKLRQSLSRFYAETGILMPCCRRTHSAIILSGSPGQRSPMHCNKKKRQSFKESTTIHNPFQTFVYPRDTSRLAGAAQGNIPPFSDELDTTRSHWLNVHETRFSGNFPGRVRIVASFGLSASALHPPHIGIWKLNPFTSVSLIPTGQASESADMHIDGCFLCGVSGLAWLQRSACILPVNLSYLCHHRFKLQMCHLKGDAVRFKHMVVAKRLLDSC